LPSVSAKDALGKPFDEAELPQQVSFSR